MADTYRIQNGDTLGALSSHFKVPIDLLAKTNNIQNVNKIRAGDVLTIPDLNPPTPVTPPAPPPPPPKPSPPEIGRIEPYTYSDAKAIPVEVVSPPATPTKAPSVSSGATPEEHLNSKQVQDFFSWAHDKIAPDKVLGMMNMLSLALGVAPKVMAPIEPPGGVIVPTARMMKRPGAKGPGADPLFYNLGKGEPILETPSPITRFRQEAKDIANTLPEVPKGMVRLWRGNRPGEVSKNPSFTSDLPGIALPFQKAYKGDLSYIDIAVSDLSKYEQKIASAPGVEFLLPKDIAASAKIVNSPTSLPSLEEIRKAGLASGELPYEGPTLTEPTPKPVGGDVVSMAGKRKKNIGILDRLTPEAKQMALDYQKEHGLTDEQLKYQVALEVQKRGE